MNRKTVVLPVLAGLLTPVLAGCGSEQSSGAGGDAIVVGTTDRFGPTRQTPAPFDPAAAYDVAAWNVMRNTFQTLVRLPRTGTEPVLDAAQRVRLHGRAERAVPLHAARRADLLQRAQAQRQGREVLPRADAGHQHRRRPLVPASPTSTGRGHRRRARSSSTSRSPTPPSPYKLSTPAAAIVDSQTYPAHSLAKGYKLTGSGPYALDSFDAKAGRPSSPRTRTTRAGSSSTTSRSSCASSTTPAAWRRRSRPVTST